MDMDFCVCCGRYVPEGTWVCRLCMEKEGLKRIAKEEPMPEKGDRLLIRRKDRKK